MKMKFDLVRLFFSALTLFICSAGFAQPDAVTVAYLQGKTPVAPDAISALGPDLFGDKLNLYSGSFSLEHTDVELPGNSQLPVAFSRQHSPGRSWLVRGALADWDIQTPRMEGTFPQSTGWVSWDGTVKRCQRTGSGPMTTVNGADFMPWEYGQGVNLVIPGSGSQEVLVRASGYTMAPGDGLAYPLVTKENWQIRCLQTIRNGAGEGFVAVGGFKVEARRRG
jgi:hypothetical protein